MKQEAREHYCVAMFIRSAMRLVCEGNTSPSPTLYDMSITQEARKTTQTLTTADADHRESVTPNSCHVAFVSKAKEF